jgi:hypothetical protein
MNNNKKEKAIFQAIYDSGINFSIECFRDDGFRIKLDDKIGYVDAWEEVEEWLHENVIKYYSDSNYAKENK